MFHREVIVRGLVTAAMLSLACKDGGTGGTGAAQGGSDNSGGGSAGNAGGGMAGTVAGGQGGDSGDGGSIGGAGGSVAAGGGGAGMGGNVAVDPLEPCATHPYCNDFETTDVGARPKGAFSVTPGNTLAVTEAKAYSGKRSLYIDVAVEGEASFSLFLRDRLKDPKYIGYARMMVWIESLSTVGAGGGYWQMLVLSGSRTTNGKFSAGVSLAGPDGTARSWFFYKGGGPGLQNLTNCYKEVTPLVLPVGQWACLEMKVDETSTTPYGISVGGKPVPEFTMGAGANCTGPPWYVPDVESVSFGWHHANKLNGTARMWIDDVVVDEKPIGCP